MDGVPKIMMKKLLFPLAALTSLHAEGIGQDNLNSIYTEAIWFVAVFTVMSIISIIISKRHAKKYAEENPVKKNDLRQRSDEAAEKSSVLDRVETRRVTAWSKLVEDGLLTEKEFQILKQYLTK